MDINIDIDKIVTDLNGKADVDLANVNNAKGVLLESYVNGASWYRIYSDGWCEQGGHLPLHEGGIDVTFLKEFKDTNYTILKTNTFYLDGATNYKYINFWNKTTTQARTLNSGTDNSGSGSDWLAFGYIK